MRSLNPEKKIYIISENDYIKCDEVIFFEPHESQSNIDNHELFRQTPLEWAIAVIQNSKQKYKIIKQHQLELAYSIIFWNTHAYYHDKKLIRVNKFNNITKYKRNDILLFKSENNLGQKLIDPIFKHYIYWAKENPNTYEANMIMYWKNKYKYKKEEC